MFGARIYHGPDAGAATDSGQAAAVDAEARTPGGVPRPPTRAPAHGTYVLSSITGAGRIEVRTWIRSAAPVAVLLLRTPEPDARPGSAVARDVEVRDQDGAVVARVEKVGPTLRRVRLNTASTSLYLTYTIEGGLDSAKPTVPGRALALVLAMVVTYDGAQDMVRHVVGADDRVLNVACRSGDDAPRACGRPIGDGRWIVDLHGERRGDQLLAQVSR
jgi:hypothetical protein